MMSGIYIMVTKDGYRVSASDQFVYLFGSYNDDSIYFTTTTTIATSTTATINTNPIVLISFSASVLPF